LAIRGTRRSINPEENVMAQHDYSRKEVLDIVEQVARQKGIPVDDFMRFAHIETGGTFNERAHNTSSGAKGLFQFVPGSARQYHLTGHEFDPTRNTEAAAQMYQDNLDSMARRNERTGNPYLSGGNTPTGLDLYLAHQQGSAGYGSVQTAIATGTFGVVRNSHGDEINMRRNVLNQIGSDAKALTGHTLAEMRGMNDGDLARTFSSYYIHKYAAISIPEKNIEPQAVVQGQGQTPAAPAQASAAVAAGAATLAATATAAATPKPGIELQAAYEAGVKYDDVKYAINIPGHALYVPGKTGKNVEQGYIDCSGWVGTLQNRTMDEINQKAGHAVFGKADRIDLGNLGSGGIVRKAFDQSGVLLDRDAILKPDALKEGMIIGLDTARTRHEHWNGIDHIVMVVRDPNTDKLLISQSTGSEGRAHHAGRGLPQAGEGPPELEAVRLRSAVQGARPAGKPHPVARAEPGQACGRAQGRCHAARRTVQAGRAQRGRAQGAGAAGPPGLRRRRRQAAGRRWPLRPQHRHGSAPAAEGQRPGGRRHCRGEDPGGNQGRTRTAVAERRAAPAQSVVHPGQQGSGTAAGRDLQGPPHAGKRCCGFDQGGACRRPAAHRLGGAQPER